MKVSENIKRLYSNQYESSITEWRLKSAYYKAKNIVELAKDTQVTSVLEIGSGEGSILYWLSEMNFSDNLNGLEISESGVELTKLKQIKHLKSIQLFDGYKIPFEDGAFDLLICSHVMEHVEHERILLREIKRVSKRQIFEVPIDFSFYVDKKISHFLSYGHINIYTPALFRFLLQSEEFQIKSDKYCLFEDDILKHTFASNKIKFYAAKTKRFLIKICPYLPGIKPNSYAVLTEHKKNQLSKGIP
jgi:ubiquinone/menaquinone biosynthesis C-methylase UbiE